ncbi:hypothetical protein CRE_06592 [Caenorhabditis remanei]|uniref:Peptidase M13 N-terminal domain-containing protein n=1 Tax=Caenorhabditis remanei TaxID=31234 RepID=E3M1P3_CAERE|nr:hypothetical protein CRE_06592 [Caenorhabditis remanei]
MGAKKKSHALKQSKPPKKSKPANKKKPSKEQKDKKKGSGNSKPANKTRSSSAPNPTSTRSTTPTPESVNAPEKKKKPLKQIALFSILCCIIIALSIALIVVISQDVPSAPASPAQETVKPRNVCETPACITLAHQLQNWQNTSVDPCHDFYKYSCGRYQEHVPFAGDSFDRKTKILKLLIEDFLTKNVPSTSKSEKSMKILYAKCKKAELWSEERDFFQQVYRHISSIGSWSHFRFIPLGVDTNLTKWLSGLRLLKKSLESQSVDFGLFSIKFNDHSKMTIEPKHILLRPPSVMMTNIHTLLRHNGIDVPDSQLSVRISQLGDFLNKLNYIPREDVSSVIEYEKANLKSRIPAIDFDAIIKDMMRSSEGFEVVKKNTFVSNSGIFSQTKQARLAVFQHFHEVFFQLSNILQNRIIAVDFLIYIFIDDAFQRYENFKNERKQQDCAQVVIDNLPHASTRVFVRNYLNKKNLKSVSDLVESEKSNFIEMIKESKQLHENSKKKAVVKVEKMKTVIGYPKEFEAPGALDNSYQLKLFPSDSYNGMLMKIERDFTKYYLDFISKKSVINPANLVLWTNAMYLEDNTLVIPPPIMDDPFFDESYPEYAKIGILGTPIGHEMGHGFDIGRIGNDENGKAGRVLTLVDLKSLMKNAKCLHKQYINYDDPDFGRQNRPDTSINEMIADSIAAKVGWKTFKKLQLSQEKEIIGYEDYDIDKLFFQIKALRFVIDRLLKSLSIHAYCYLAFVLLILSIGTSCFGSDLSEKESLAWWFWIIAFGLVCSKYLEVVLPRFGLWNASVQFYCVLIALFSVTAFFHYIESSKSFSKFMKEKGTFLTLNAIFAAIKCIFLVRAAAQLAAQPAKQFVEHPIEQPVQPVEQPAEQAVEQHEVVQLPRQDESRSSQEEMQQGGGIRQRRFVSQ